MSDSSVDTQCVTYHIFPGSISLYAQGRFHLVAKGDPRFEPLGTSLAAGDVAGACQLLAEAAQIDIKKILLGDDGVMRYQEREIPTVLSEKYVELRQAGSKNAVGILNYWLNETLSGRSLDLAFLNRVVPLPSCYPATPYGFHILYDAKEAGFSPKRPAPVKGSFYNYDQLPEYFKLPFSNGVGLADMVGTLFVDSSPGVVRRLETLMFDKSVGRVDCSPLTLGAITAGLLPTNQLLEVLTGWTSPLSTDGLQTADSEDANGGDEDAPELGEDLMNEAALKTVREVLSLFTPVKIRNFLTARPGDETLMSIASAWPRLSEQVDLTAHRFSSLAQVADLLRLELVKLDKKDYPLAMESRYPTLAQLNGSELGGGITLRVPATNSQLSEWSSLLSNCLHGYGKRCAEGNCVVIGVEVGGRLSYAIEIERGRVSQFKGKSNRAPQTSHRLLVEKALAESGLLTKESPKGRKDRVR